MRPLSPGNYGSRMKEKIVEAVRAQNPPKQARAQIETRDLELINEVADELNAEVEDVLRYQASVE